MKAVLMSIRPKWCEKIFNGEKAIEVRKTAPKLETPFTVYVYQTKYKFEKGDSRLVVDAMNEITAGGKVIGSFICDTFVFDKTYGKDVLFNAAACLSQEEAEKYSNLQMLYGWHITEPKLFDKPRELSEFYMLCKLIDRTDDFCEGKRLIVRPPQSWCYVEDDR